MTRYLVGIDNGSQSSKVTVFDERGGVVAEGRVPLRPNHTPEPGVVEHPDDDLWDSIAAACRLAMAAFPGDPSDIVGVGLCTIRFCRAVLRADGSLAQPVMSWMDARVGGPFVAEHDDVAYVTTSSGYVTHRLTGAFRDTAANYQGSWPIDTDTWRWADDPARYAATGLDRSQLFELVDPGAVLGTVTADAAAATGLPEGLPVVATANDKAVEALGCGLLDPSTLLVSLGTYIAGMSVGERNITSATDFWTNFGSEPGRWLYESGGIRRGMWTVSWFRDLLGPGAVAAAGDERVEDVLNREAAQVPPGSDGLLTVLDWLAPTDAPFRKGSMLGFDGRQGRAHVYRSILEGIAMTMRNRADAMGTELGTCYERVVVSGGGSSSDLMMQVMADVFQRPTIRVVGDSAAGRGAAICAAVATGVHPSFDAAAAAMVVERDRFAPDPEHAAVYDALRAVHADVTAHTDAVYRRTAAIVG
ncbi:sugar (pentulose or hexulose) kinase [Curtobacterium luteum]|uniref:Kinase n=1 Tax=Curtobacterium luteum TaxID=33881 RepID=A0A8H9GAF1_9MICO|nr:FGGY-family carbohydrate kinase [Curtobacterium luteum]MBM7803783.1 sugar (pentulose or hexulose) kinase [Curtobacterium luteum]NUU51493.1 sugar kinase [Curtobacterium luteum]GGL02569.1 kinase [Curtobacterium luteum]